MLKVNCTEEPIMVLDNQGYVKLLDVMGDSLTIVNAAQMSYNRKSDKFGVKEESILKSILSKGHTSPFEMTEFMFEIKAPIFIARQWMRHRTWSYNEVSRRLVKENVEYYYPYSYNPEIDNIIKESYKASDEAYKKLLSLGVLPQEARAVLPLSMMTKFLAKVDGNNLIKFCILRSNKSAQKEIQEYSKALMIATRPYLLDIWEMLANEGKVPKVF